MNANFMYLKCYKIFFISLIFVFQVLHSITSWQALTSERFTVIYPAGYQEQAYETISAMEHYADKVHALVDYTPRRTVIVLEDSGSIANGYADFINREIHLYVSSPADDELLGFRDWIAMVGVHEYTHHCHLSKFGGSLTLPRVLFGNTFLAFFYPAWFLEGLAVYAETRIFPDSGRLYEGYYDAVSYAMLSGRRFPSIRFATWEPFSFPWGNTRYIFGTLFMNYLSRTYGEESITRFLNIYHRDNVSFAQKFLMPVTFNSALRRTFNRKSALTLWSDFRAAETKRLSGRKETAAQVTRSGGEKKYLLANGDGLYYVQQHRVKTGPDRMRSWSEIRHISTFNKSKDSLILKTSDSIVMPLRSHENRIYFASTEYGRNYANTSDQSFGYECVLYSVDSAAGRYRKKIYQGSLRAFTVRADGSVFCARDIAPPGGSEVFELVPQSDGRHLERVLFSTDLLINELASSGGTIIAAAKKSREHYSLYQVSETTGNLTLLANTPFTEKHISFSGGALIYSADYGREHAAYRMDLTDRAANSLPVQRLTGSGYAVYPAIDQTGQLYYISVTADGTDIMRSVAVPAVYDLPQARIQERPSYSFRQSEVTRRGYSANLGTMAPKLYFLYPLVSIDSRGRFYNWGTGYQCSGKDALGHFEYFAGLEYIPALHHSLAYSLGLTLGFLPPLSMQFEVYQNKYIPAENFFSSGNEPGFTASLSYPFFISASEGLSGITGFLGYTSEQSDVYGYQDRYSQAGLAVSARGPGARYRLSISSIFETPWIGSERTDFGINGLLGGSHFTQHGELSAGLNVLYRPGRRGWVGNLRGEYPYYFNEYSAELELDYSFRVLPLRFGSWYMQTYVEDWLASVFAAAAVSGQKFRWSIGLETFVEVRILRIGLPLTFGIGAAVNNDLEPSIFFPQFSSSF